MQNFMPGTQPRGTYSFDPSAAASSTQSVQMLNTVNAEEDGAEDQVGPPFDVSLANVAGASSFPPVTSDPDRIAGTSFPPVTSYLNHVASTSSFPPSDLDHDFLGFGVTPSVASESSLSLPPDFASASGGTRPPSSSSLPPMTHPYSTQRHDISIGSAFSRNTDSDPGNTQLRNTDSDPGNTQLRKRKHDGRSAGGARPPSTKRLSRSKTSDLNPVIISNSLNSTLNRLADVMEKTLDTTATTIAPTTAPATGAVTPPSDSQTLPFSNQPSASPQAILNQAIKVATSIDTLSEDDLLLASLFFTSATEEAIRAARTFIALDNNPVVQRRFLLHQLNLAAPSLLPGLGKGKGKATEDNDSMIY